MANHNRTLTCLVRLVQRLSIEQDGLLTAVQLVTVAFFAATALLLLTVTERLQQKLTLQSAADASAEAAAVWLARGMNALCTTNHLIGEAVAMVIIHEALVGPDPNGTAGDTSVADKALDVAHQELLAALANPPDGPAVADVGPARLLASEAAPFAFEQVRLPVRAQGAILQAMRRLKTLLAKIYDDKLAATRAANHGRMTDLNRQEQQLLTEYQVLAELLRRAGSRSIIEARDALLKDAIPALRDYSHQLVQDVPSIATTAAEQIALVNGARSELYPRQPSLPVELDPLATAQDLTPIPPEWYGPRKPTAYFPPPPDVPVGPITRRQIVKVTQLCRAAFPWVNFHRQPIREYLANCCPLSQAESIYFAETTRVTLDLCDQLQAKAGLGLYVIKHATLPDKGFERWTDDPSEVDTMFTVISVARLADSPIAPDQRSEMPLPPSATARALIYSAHAQVPHEKRIDLHTKRIVPIRQPQTGWDTLQWIPTQDKEASGDPLPSSPPKKRNMPFELIGKGSLLLPEFPRIQVAWQAKRVPVAVNASSPSSPPPPDLHLGKMPREVRFLKDYSELATH